MRKQQKDYNMNYNIIRSKRKTAAIHILPEGIVEVRAPLKMPKNDIDRFVASKEMWIQKKLLLTKERLNSRAAFQLDYGNCVLVRGREYPIVSKPGNRIGFDDTQFFMVPGLNSVQIKDACVHIYKLIAKQVLTAKTLEYASKMGVMPSNVKINSAKTRWGSCSGNKSINYSWRLIMAEDDVIDYVVVHELAHLKEMNHSAGFWAIVKGVLPDYKGRQQLLKALQKRLGTEDWE
jgi:predicted metal-dependent hydrolase